MQVMVIVACNRIELVRTELSLMTYVIAAVKLIVFGRTTSGGG